MRRDFRCGDAVQWDMESASRLCRCGGGSLLERALRKVFNRNRLFGPCWFACSLFEIQISNYKTSLMSSIVIQNLHASIGDKEIIRGLSLEFSKGEVHAVMGPNGSGKSTLAKVMAGHPDYEVTEGDIFLDGESILEMETDERARKGLFLAFQY